MTAETIELNGKTYQVFKTRTKERFVRVHVDDLVPGMVLDMGTYVERREAMFQGEVNPNTWDMILDRGRYTETRGPVVRVWIHG